MDDEQVAAEVTVDDEQVAAGAIADDEQVADEVTAERVRLRAAGRACRAALVGRARARATARVIARLAAHPAVEAADGVLLTVAVRGELDLADLRGLLLARGTAVALPVVDGADLRPVAWTPDVVLRPGWRDVPEPDGPVADVDTGAWVALVPGTAFGRDGSRIGQGGGHFDRFLAAHPDVLPIGVCFACQLHDHVPLLPHDVVMADVVSDA